MRNRIPIALFSSALLFISADRLINHSESKKVFVCDSENATKYHLKSNCKGLEKCDHDVLKLTKEEAIKKGKTELCGYED